MKTQKRFSFNSFVLIAVVAAASLQLNDAAAQHYDGCFMNGQQVADSMCQSGGGGGSAPSMMSNPAFGALSSMSFALGAAMGTAIRNSLQNNPGNAPATAPAPQPDPAAVRAEQQRRMQIEQENARAEAERQQRSFLAGQHTLVNEMRSLDEPPVAHVAPREAAHAELGPRSLGGQAEPAKPASPQASRSATLRVVNQTDAYVTVSVDGAYGCNTAGGTTCMIPVTTGHHDLRAVRTDTGAVFTQSVDVPDNGVIWPLSGT